MCLYNFIAYLIIYIYMGGVKTPNYHFCEGGLVVHPMVT